MTYPPINRGFTIIELITAVSVFLVIMVISMGSILGVFNANTKSRTLRAAITNLNFAVESMSKEMRFGHEYYCGAGTGTQDCPSGDYQMSFHDADDHIIYYRLATNIIEKKEDSGPYIRLTPPEVVIDSLNFYVLNSQPLSGGDSNQPKVLIKIQSHVGGGKTRTDFALQTLVSQRILDY